MLNELILDAGARIGELTREIPKAPTGGNRGNQYTGGVCDSGDTKAKTKEQIGAELGFSRQNMSRFEKLADHPAGNDTTNSPAEGKQKAERIIMSSRLFLYADLLFIPCCR